MWHDYLGHGGPGSDRCTGKPVATVARDLALAPDGWCEKVSPGGGFP